jgi:hypothetical protein
MWMKMKGQKLCLAKTNSQSKGLIEGGSIDYYLWMNVMNVISDKCLGLGKLWICEWM